MSMRPLAAMKQWRMTAGVLAALCLALPVRALEPVQRDAAAVDKAVARGLNYLVTRQHSNGVIVATAPPNEPLGTAMTGLAGMALLSVGHRPTDATPAGHTLAKALDYILDPKRQDGTGYYGNDGGNMYGHGIVTLLLAEMVGMGVDARQDALIRERCQKAVDLIVRAQKVTKAATFKGGWRYQPISNDADLSVSVWQVMALRAAKNAGLTVPKDTIEDAIAYLKRSYSSGRDKEGKLLNLKSGFAYQPGGGPSYAMACAGLLALQVCGDYEAPELKGTTEWLREYPPKNASFSYFYYGTYYYAQGLYQRGGETARAAQALVESLLLAEQKEDGRWQSGGSETSPILCTTLAIMSLSVRHHFMPIYQR